MISTRLKVYVLLATDLTPLAVEALFAHFCGVKKLSDIKIEIADFGSRQRLRTRSAHLAENASSIGFNVQLFDAVKAL